MISSYSTTTYICEHLGNHKKPGNDFQLGYYLAGLIEGDGCFSHNKLEIAFHEKDKSAAYSLRRQLGFGQIYTYSQNRKAVRFIISNIKGLKRVLNLVNGKFVCLAKINQLIDKGYESRLGCKILNASSKICLTNHWLAGFLDADGSIGIFIANSKTHKHKKSVRLEIKFTQKDKNILSLIGSIFEVKSIYKDKKKIHRLKLTGSNKIKKMISYLDDYHLQTVKYTQYTIFRRCARYVQSKKHLEFNGLEKIYRFKRSLQSVYN
jgi:hypothetical protein